MDYWHDIAPGEDVPNEISVIVEIPKGSQNKYEYDKKNGIMALDRVLFSPMHYPGDYGLVPQTLGEDGDPLDALVLLDDSTYPGILIKARPVGSLSMIDGGEGDDKLLCVPVDDPRAKRIKDISDVEKHRLDEIAHFFETYKQLEGKEVKIGGWQDAKAAHKLIEESIARYKEKYPE